MAITVAVSDLTRDVTSKRIHRGKLVTSGTYETNGFAVSAANLALDSVERVTFTDAGGYSLEYVLSTGKVKVYRSAGFTPAGTNGTSAVTGTAAAQTFTGDALGTHGHTFTGDALAAHRHELFVATGASDTANTRVNVITDEFSITDAAVTIAGIASAAGANGGIVDVTGGTPAGTNAVTSGGTPSGTNSASASLSATAAGQTFTGTAVAAAALLEVANGVSLAITTYFEAIGK